MAIGDITAKDSLTRSDVGTGGKWCKANGNYWILAYRKVSTDTMTVETYTVNPDTGDISSLVDTQDFTELYRAPSFAKQIAEGVVALWGSTGSTVGGDGRIITVAVSSAGIINATILGSLVWKVVDDTTESITYQFDAVNTSDTYWAFSFGWGVYTDAWAYTWRLAVVSISADGATLSVTDDDQVSAYTSGNRCNTIAVSGTIFAVGVDTGKVITVDINTSGVITNAGVDSNDFSVSGYNWIERLTNGWCVMVYRSGTTGRADSFGINDAGVIDDSFTDFGQIGPTSPVDATIFDLGGSSTSYAIISVGDSVLDSWVITCSCDIAGTISTLQTLEWDTSDLYGRSMAKVTHNMFLVEGDTSSSNDIYSETIGIVSAYTVYPTGPTTRVTSLVHHFDRSGGKGVLELEINLGEVVADFGLPRLPSETAEEPGVPYVTCAYCGEKIPWTEYGYHLLYNHFDIVHGVPG